MENETTTETKTLQEDVRDLVIPGAIVSQNKSCASLIVQTVITHSNCSEQPLQVQASFIQNLETDEQSYGPRRVTVKGDWTPLDLGWLADKPISYLVIQDRSGLLDGRKTQVSIDGVLVASIKPGRFFSLEPEEGVASKIKLKSLGGDSILHVSVMPT